VLVVLAAQVAATLAASPPALAAPLGEVHEFPLPAGVNAESIAAGPEGDMWFTEVPNKAIGRITSGGTITEFPGLKSEAYEITLGLEGDMWFTEPAARTIGRITPGGEIKEFSEGLNEHPFAITRGPEGYLWFTTPHTVGRITPAGQITEFKKGLFGTPVSITAGADGVLRVTLDCSGRPCSGTVKLTYKTKVTTGTGKHKKTKTVSATIATGTFTALALGADKVTLKLASHGLSLLAAHGYKLGATASISYISSGASHANTVGTIELKGIKPKPKRKG
jgi:hypothetical protein